MGLCCSSTALVRIRAHASGRADSRIVCSSKTNGLGVGSVRYWRNTCRLLEKSLMRRGCAWQCTRAMLSFLDYRTGRGHVSEILQQEKNLR